MNKLILNYDITKIKGAEYNPRKINDKQLGLLRDSVNTLGIVKPIIVNGNTIIAGHQRTKALLAQGISFAPVIELASKVNTYDEVRFNQLHNGTDLDCGDENCKVELSSLAENITHQFVEVEPSKITGNLKCKYAPVRREIARLISQYGGWGAVVATKSGEVIHAAQYALACIITATPLLVYVIEDSEKSLYQFYLNKQYGEFSYEHLGKDTYIQTLAQMMRLRNGKQNASTLYENYVLKTINKSDRGLDFGSGQGDYAKRLRSEGFRLLDIELFRRKGASNTFDVRAINKMISEFILDYHQNGKLDYVVCDSVMNSVDCEKAERSILDFLNFAVKDNGLLFISGRPRSVVDGYMNMSKLAAKKRVVEFLDKDGYSAIYRKGHWFYQKFHTQEQFEASLAESGFEVLSFKNSGTSWQCVARKTKSLTIDRWVAAIDYEFELPLSKTIRIGRSSDVLRLIDYEGGDKTKN